jgi:hypothetical protein
MNFRLFSLFVLLAASTIHAQQPSVSLPKKDSLRLKFTLDSTQLYKNRTVIPYIALDFRNAYTTERFLSFLGPQIGVNIRDRHIFALGFYFLNKISIFQSDKYRNYSFEKINYATLIYLYKIYNSKSFDILAPMEVGYGNYRAEDESKGSGEFVASSIFPVGLGIRFDFLPHKWIGFKIGVGYRYIYEVNSKIGLDGAYFTTGIKLDLRHIYQDYSFYRLKKKYKHNLRNRENM